MEVTAKVLHVLDAMHSQDMNVPIFMEALCYGGDDACRSNPRRRPAGARQTLEEFAIECTIKIVEREIERIASHFLSAPDELSQEHLTNFDFEGFTELIENEGPVLWRLLDKFAYSDKQRSRNTHKGPNMVILHLISQLQYTRSNRRSRITKLWVVYLKACGLSARAFDALHALGIVMSHKWAANVYGQLSHRAMDEVRLEVRKSPWIISHNNVNIPMRVFSQRLNNQSHFTSGCAATVWVLPREALLPSTANQDFRAFRQSGMTRQFSFGAIQDYDPAVYTRIKLQHIHYVLRILLDSPGFAEYADRDHAKFEPPPPVDLLPCGPENIIKQYILGTTDIEEASYEGNDKVVAEIFRQLGLDSEAEMKKTGTERVIPWIGDQMTVEGLRGLIRYRHEDFNSFDRMDYTIPVFGWFHLQMALANSIHKQYLGTSSGIGGLQQAFDLLHCKGLQKAETKGPFWHHLDEALHHIAEAHIRASWLATAKVESLNQLIKKSPQDLHSLAIKLIDEHTSRNSIRKLTRLPDKNRDQVLEQFTIYIELTAAMKVGDVGRMEDLLPTLLMRFAGGGNSKYTIEILELIQGLQQEWTEHIRQHIQKYCWLINRSGKRDGWLPIDKGQEQNIKDIKVTYHSLGPGATWEYLHKVSPAIPTLRALQRHMENEFQTITRGSHHGTPTKENDVAKLTEQYAASNIHEYEPGRYLKTNNKAEDYISNGVVDLERSGTIENWWSNRTYARATSEIWDLEVRA
ncbi:hypothetical protein BJ138DRAFT_1138187 [Hygrophoropsis aurantiaca]|uniref:Uncharacterized protein n=1 Tax=Hygrophoropsis aurantiaca TaxID=72124 RepID=A0ACB7ZXC0_9AGAM|nr:hypothetical protein BJ138DRAFT_1138187 [Hygrophoropsis aurantiaca]